MQRMAAELLQKPGTGKTLLWHILVFKGMWTESQPTKISRYVRSALERWLQKVVTHKSKLFLHVWNCHPKIDQQMKGGAGISKPMGMWTIDVECSGQLRTLEGAIARGTFSHSKQQKVWRDDIVVMYCVCRTLCPCSQLRRTALSGCFECWIAKL